jgi:uncharacterized protein (TIGR02118 family)
MRKVVCVVHAPLGLDVPSDDGIVGYSVVVPASGIEAEHPGDVGGVASVWVDDDSDIAPDRWFPGARVDVYLVRENVVIDYDRDWPDGDVSPGVHRTVFVRRAPRLTRDEMATHWAERHAPLVHLHHPGFWQYVQNVVVDAATPGAPEVDGIAEMHFKSLEELRNRFYDSDDGRAVIQKDVAKFLDRGQGWRILGEEHWVVTPSTRAPPGR